MHRNRALAYADAVARYALDADPALNVLGDRDFVPLREAVERVLDASPLPTAIFASMDDRALSWMDALRERGLRVPEDISVVGFDDAPAAAVAGLTTIRQPCEELGRLAARMLHDLLHGRPAAECRAELPVELIVRTSTAPPRAVR
jgi:LacI family transcriptional regulator